VAVAVTVTVAVAVALAVAVAVAVALAVAVAVAVAGAVTGAAAVAVPGSLDPERTATSSAMRAAPLPIRAGVGRSRRARKSHTFPAGQQGWACWYCFRHVGCRPCRERGAVTGALCGPTAREGHGGGSRLGAGGAGAGAGAGGPGARGRAKGEGQRARRIRLGSAWQKEAEGAREGRSTRRGWEVACLSLEKDGQGWRCRRCRGTNSGTRFRAFWAERPRRARANKEQDRVGASYGA